MSSNRFDIAHRATMAVLLLAAAALGAQELPGPSDEILAAEAELFGGGGASAEDELFGASAEDELFGASAEDELFGGGETIVQAAENPDEAGAGSGFLKYDEVKVGGSFSGSVGFGAYWPDAWSGEDELFTRDRSLSPAASGKVTLVAKPSEDFGVNMDFRTSWPFSSGGSLATAEMDPLTRTPAVTGVESVSIPNISVWALYSKFNWDDRIYFSFGKQPLSWGVSKGAFQPADDIFALSADIDLADTGAEREGPVSLKVTVPLGVTNNFYFYAGIPTEGEGEELDVADARLAAKAEYGFGNTELALGAYYSYNDHPRLLAMATTGIGSWNLYGEGILKYGSERYFIEKDASSVSMTNPLGLVGEQEEGRLYFSGTLGGYYSNADGDLTFAAAYLYNGEAQRDLDFDEAFAYYMLNPDDMDRSKFGAHYAFASLGKTGIVKDRAGDSVLAASLIAIADLADRSGYLMPSLTWTFFDYLSLKVGGTFNFGAAGSEYVTYGVGGDVDFPALPTKPGAALSLTLTVGSGSF